MNKLLADVALIQQCTCIACRMHVFIIGHYIARKDTKPYKSD